MKSVVISGKHTIILDELAKKSLNTAWDIIKRYSNGLSNTTIREMYSDKADKFASYGMLFICTNVIPDLPINDNALLNRLDILVLPNRFAENPREHEYKIASGLEYKLENDFAGLEWLVNASIKAYKSIGNGTFRAKQSYKETLKIIKETDDILNYIIDYTEISFASKTYNSEIVANYRAYCSEHNISLSETDKNLAKDIGFALNTCYGDKLEKELDRTYIDLLFGGSCITVYENGKIRAPTEEDFERIKMIIEGKMIQEGIRVDEIPLEELKRKFGY